MLGPWGRILLLAAVVVSTFGYLSGMTLAVPRALFAFARDGSGRVALTFIGEGGTSLGEWHEAINLCAIRRLPIVFAVENNQTALSTPVREQSAARVFADKASGYGIPGITIDGTDCDEIAAAFAWAVERARAGRGPSLIELVSMRMSGHAHHDDMLYLGKDPQPGWEYPTLHPSGYADPERYAFWSARDPIPAYADRLRQEGLIDDGELDRLKTECEALVEFEAQGQARALGPVKVSHSVRVQGEPAVDEMGQPQGRPPYDVVRIAAQEFTGSEGGVVGERQVDRIQLRFGLGQGHQHTLAEVGEQLQISRERVRQIENEALQKLRRLDGDRLFAYHQEL